MKHGQHRIRAAATILIAAATVTTGLAGATGAFAGSGDRTPQGGSPGRAASALVQTAQGKLKGVVTDDHREFLGVRYAAPVERWKRPEPAKNWQGTKNATTVGNECVQKAVFWRTTSPASTTEDCLFLNVYTPRQEISSKPVLVFFHGGGGINGAATDAVPARMASEAGVVVISANYRLGVLGGINLPALDAESPDGKSGGNYANLDKIQVLKWVQQNAAAFGGDPKRVTVAGQSAGAGAVCWLLASPSAKGLFSSAIVESAGACGGASTREASYTAGLKFATAAGCTDAATALTCLRSKSAAEILETQVAQNTGAGTVYGGSDLPLRPSDAFEAGEFNKVPVIFGNTRNEARAFVYEANDLVRQPLIPSVFESQIKTTYTSRADKILAEYPVADYESAGVARAKVQTDDRVCTALPFSRSIAKWAPTYTYEFRDETAPLRQYMTVPSSFTIGSGHTSEVPYLWGSETATPLTRSQLKLSDVMISAWTKFAETGSPNDSGLPKWPAFTSDSELRIGFLAGGRTETISGSDFVAEHHCGMWLS